MRWSQISVVVMSRTHFIIPESTSFSKDWPPVPVAWKTRQSKSFSMVWRTMSTQGVVTPNMVMPRRGRSSPWGTGPLTMPARALAAFARTTLETLLIPDTSVTEYIMAISLGPT
jgi:hypothetical protein